MPGYPFTPSWRTAAATMAVGLMLGGLAFPAGAAPAPLAAAPTVVKVCVNKKSGAMRQVKKKSKCRSAERFLKWNTTGPAGPTGPTGPTGPGGATGAPGPSHSYQAIQTGSTNVPGVTAVPIASVTVPAGTYVLSGQLVAGAASAASVTVVCGYLVDSVAVEAAANGYAIVPASDIRQIIASGSYTASTTTTISLACSAIGGSVVTQFGGMTATQVGALN